MSEPVNQGVVFAVDFGGTYLRIALLDALGRIHQQSKQPTPKGESPHCVVDALVAAAGKWSNNDGPPIVAASIMVPGTVDANNATVVQAPNLPSLSNFSLKAVLEDRLGWPVLVENDANAAAVGEMWFGAARGYRDVVSVTLGTGVGGGVILDGQLWRGAHGSAGEIGHATVDPFSSLRCKCGNIGCLELFASATAIVRMTREGLPQFPDSVLNRRELTAEVVYEAGRAGDELALSVFKTFGSYLGIGLANLINIVDPEIIVLAGGMSAAADLFLPELRRAMRERAQPLAARQVRIAVSRLGGDANLLGAARVAFAALSS
jgi:glucokinase